MSSSPAAMLLARFRHTDPLPPFALQVLREAPHVLDGYEAARWIEHPQVPMELAEQLWRAHPGVSTAQAWLRRVGAPSVEQVAEALPDLDAHDLSWAAAQAFPIPVDAALAELKLQRSTGDLAPALHAWAAVHPEHVGAKTAERALRSLLDAGDPGLRAGADYEAQWAVGILFADAETCARRGRDILARVWEFELAEYDLRDLSTVLPEPERLTPEHAGLLADVLEDVDSEFLTGYVAEGNWLVALTRLRERQLGSSFSANQVQSLLEQGRWWPALQVATACAVPITPESLPVAALTAAVQHPAVRAAQALLAECAPTLAAMATRLLPDFSGTVGELLVAARAVTEPSLAGPGRPTLPA